MLKLKKDSTQKKAFNVFSYSFFLKKYNKFWSLRLWKFLLKYEKFFMLRARKFHFLKYNKIFKSGVFYYFLSSESWKYKKRFRISVYWNVRRFRFLKYKGFLWDFRVPKYKKFSQGGFFLFFEFGLERGPGSCILYYLFSANIHNFS